MALCVAAALVPVLAVDQVLDHYVRGHETSRAQKQLDTITTESQSAVYAGLTAIKSVLANSPSLCTPTFLANVRAEVQKSVVVRQMLVEGEDGLQYCDVYEQAVNYTPVSQTLSMPGRNETVTVVRLQEHEIPVLKITHLAGTRYLSAFVLLGMHVSDHALDELYPLSAVKLSFTNGEDIVTLGNYGAFERRTNDADYIAVNSFAGDVPVRGQAAAVFGDVRTEYAELDIVFTVISCLISIGFLLLAFQYLRRSAGAALDLEGAIRAGELKPYYQPFIDLTSGRLLGCEVLVRWEKPNGKMVPPGAFIDYAEHSGLALPMTISLMQQVKEEMERLCAEMPTLKISINLFEGHFRDETIIEDIQAIFGDSKIRFEQLVFEITERRPLTNNTQAYNVIARLHELGSRLAMDDVGTGHSNLAVIQTLGVDIIKIDRVFVDMVKEGTTEVPVLDGLINMAKGLGAEIVAEGVETEAQALYLRDRGVTHAQGFLFAPALKPKHFKTLARTLNGRPALKTNDGPPRNDSVESEESSAA